MSLTPVQKEYEKNSDIKPEDIKNIRDWLIKQPHLPHDFITDFDLIMAFYCCECCSELTKTVIDLHYTLRTLFTFYQNRRVDERLRTALDCWLITPLKETTRNGNQAIYCQILNTDPTSFVYAEVVRAFVMIMDLWQFEEGSMSGVAVIVNMKNVSLGHLSRIDLSVAQQFFYFLQEAMFVRLKEFHFINAPSIVETLLSMLSPFLKRDMLDFLRIHKVGSNTFEEILPQAALPKDAGGMNKEGYVLKDEIWDKIKQNEKFFQEESMKRNDESKRSGGPKTLGTFFNGIDETFRKLTID